MKYLFSLILFGFFLGCVPTVRADYCIGPDVEGGLAIASTVFSGKIVEVRRIEDISGRYPADSFEYIVKFEVEEMWKGREAKEVSVTWRTKLPFCSSYFSVGEVGERYLVYADPASEDTSQNSLPVVTIFNRTSRIPAQAQPEQPFEVEDLEKNSRTLLKVPELNRTDASQDLALLRRLRGCDCLGSNNKSTSCLNTLGHLKETADNDLAIAACCKCLRQYYRYSLN